MAYVTIIVSVSAMILLVNGFTTYGILLGIASICFMFVS